MTTVEIITIGDEILIGQVVDTNSAWIANELTKAGFNVGRTVSVGDSAGDITEAIDSAFNRADVLLLTGGIGPTNDDITKNTLCRYFQTSLVFDDDVIANIESMFARRGIQLNNLTRNQAFVPKAATVIQNKTGTAPILWFNRDKKVLVSMPGVPFEMRAAMTADILPRLKQTFDTEDYLKQSFLVAGISESALATQLETFEKKLPYGFGLAYLPSYGLIRLRLSVRGEEFADEMQTQADKLKSLLGDLLVAENENSLEVMLGQKLKEANLTVSTAESCTGGLIAHKIVSPAGASQYFAGSVVAYSNEIKTAVLGVDRTTIEHNGAVSQPVVEQMALNCARMFATECSIAVSGIAGPDGATPDKPIGTVWICTRMGNQSVARVYNTGSSRSENMERAANMAILQLLRMIH